MVDGVSFDVWGTIFGDAFFSEIEEHYTEYTGTSRTEIAQSMQRAYEVLREKRKEGAIGKGIDPVAYSLELLEPFGVNIDAFKNAMAAALISIDIEKLLMPGMREAIEELYKDHALVILGNVVYWPGAYTRALISKAGLSKFFRAQLYSDEIGCAKPSREAFSKALSLLGITDPRRAAHVGDNFYEDFCGAIGSNFHAVMLTRDVTQTTVIGGNAFVRDASQLPLTIRGLRGQGQSAPLSANPGLIGRFAKAPLLFSWAKAKGKAVEAKRQPETRVCWKLSKQVCAKTAARSTCLSPCSGS
ncbi:MAG: HAD family hydrolase [Thermoprotei archaeon]